MGGLPLAGGMATRKIEAVGLRMSCGESPRSCVRALGELRKKKKWRDALDLLRCMGHRWLQRNIICVGATISSFGCLEAPRWTWGLQLLRQAEGDSLEISHITINCAISICEKSRAWRCGFQLLDGIGCIGHGHVSVAPECREQHLVSCNAALSGLKGLKGLGATVTVATATWHKAIALLHKMHRDGFIEPDIVSFGTALRVLADCDSVQPWQQSLKLFQEVSAGLLEPGGHIFAALILSLAASWRRALASLPRHADVTTRNAALAACCGAGWQAALVILKTLQQEKVADVISYTTAISALSKQHWQLALHLVADLRSARLRMDVTCLASAAACQSWERAIHLLLAGRSWAVAPDTICYNQLLAIAEAEEQWMVATSLLECLQSSSCLADVVSFNSAISSMQKARAWTRAFQCSLRVAPLQPDVVTFSALVSAAEKANSWSLATQLLGGWSPGLVAFNAAIAACEKGLGWRQGLEILHPMRRQLKPDATTFISLIACAARSTAWEMSGMLWEDLDAHLGLSASQRYSLMLAYESLLSAYVLVGQGTSAASLMDGICEEGASLLKSLA
eukprot:s678_g4.t1